MSLNVTLETVLFISRYCSLGITLFFIFHIIWLAYILPKSRQLSFKMHNAVKLEPRANTGDSGMMWPHDCTSPPETRIKMVIRKTLTKNNSALYSNWCYNTAVILKILLHKPKQETSYLTVMKQTWEAKLVYYYLSLKKKVLSSKKISTNNQGLLKRLREESRTKTLSIFWRAKKLKLFLHIRSYFLLRVNNRI